MAITTIETASLAPTTGYSATSRTRSLALPAAPTPRAATPLPRRQPAWWTRAALY